MTGTSNASNGDKTTAKEAVQPEHGMSVLRNIEAKGLITLVCDALRQAMSVTHEMHGAIYKYDQEAKVSQEDLCRMREDALVCLSTSEHYLLMLGSVIEDQASNAEPWSQRAPYPVYMRSSEATDGR